MDSEPNEPERWIASFNPFDEDVIVAERPTDGAERLALFEQLIASRKRPISGHALQRPWVLYPGLASRPIFEAERFPWVPALLERTGEIAEELRGLQRRRDREGFISVWGTNVDRGSWGALWLSFYGQRYPENADACPRTLAAVESVPRRSGWLGFSAMAPRTHIVAHCGHINARLRCHVPLELEAGRSRIRVGDQLHTWTQREVFIFDDSFEHEAWNDSDARRVMLVFDVWHPDLTDAEVRALTDWERRFIAPAAHQSMQTFHRTSKPAETAWAHDAPAD